MKCNTVKSVFQSYKKISDFVTQNDYYEKIFVTFTAKHKKCCSQRDKKRNYARQRQSLFPTGLENKACI